MYSLIYILLLQLYFLQKILGDNVFPGEYDNIFFSGSEKITERQFFVFTSSL